MAQKRATRKLVTLKQVHELAKGDQGFLDALIRDPQKALEERDIRLTDKNLEKLKKWLEELLLAIVKFLMTEMRGKIYPWP